MIIAILLFFVSDYLKLMIKDLYLLLMKLFQNSRFGETYLIIIYK